jgi:hypothetical protein
MLRGVSKRLETRPELAFRKLAVFLSLIGVSRWKTAVLGSSCLANEMRLAIRYSRLATELCRGGAMFRERRAVES